MSCTILWAVSGSPCRTWSGRAKSELAPALSAQPWQLAGSWRSLIAATHPLRGAPLPISDERARRPAPPLKYAPPGAPPRTHLGSIGSDRTAAAPGAHALRPPANGQPVRALGSAGRASRPPTDRGSTGAQRIDRLPRHSSSPTGARPGHRHRAAAGGGRRAARRQQQHRHPPRARQLAGLLLAPAQQPAGCH